MTEKLLLLVLIYIAISIADIKKLKNLGRREILAYSVMVLLSIYLSINYVLELNWPFLEEASSALIGEPARRIIDYLKDSS